MKNTSSNKFSQTDFEYWGRMLHEVGCACYLSAVTPRVQVLIFGLLLPIALARSNVSFPSIATVAYRILGSLSALQFNNNFSSNDQGMIRQILSLLERTDKGSDNATLGAISSCPNYVY
jgi:hypothetical protein